MYSGFGHPQTLAAHARCHGNKIEIRQVRLLYRLIGGKAESRRKLLQGGVAAIVQDQENPPAA